jgi:hypothetical protein
VNIRFICDNTNLIFRAWLKKKPGFDQKHDMEIEKLQLEKEKLDKQKRAIWDALWKDLQAQGLIPKDFIREQWGMSYNPETQQLFLVPGNSPGSAANLIELPEEFLNAFRGGQPPQGFRPEGH